MSSLSNQLNLTPSSIRQKSLGARSYKMQLNPINGSTFGSQEVLKFQLPTLSRTYLDFSQAVLRGKIAITSASANSVSFLERNIYSLFNRIETLSGNVQIDNISNVNVLMHALNDLGQGPIPSAFSHDSLLSGGDPCNKTLSQPLTTATTKPFACPLPPLGFFSVDDKLIDLDCAEGLILSFHLEDYRVALIQGSAAPTGYTLSELTLEFPNCVELTPEAQAAVNSSLGASPVVYDYNTVSSTNFSKTANDTVLSQNIGVRVSSLEKCLVLHRNSGNTQTVNQASLSNRSHANLSEFQLKIGGVSYPQISLKHSADNQADVMAELQRFDGGYGFASLIGSVNQPALMNFVTLDKVSLCAADADAAAVRTALIALQQSIHSSLIGSTAASNTNLKAATCGDHNDTTNTFIRPSANANLTNTNNDPNRVTQFGIENGTLATTNAAGLTRATQLTQVGTFMVGLDLSVFDSGALYNPLSSLGQPVTIDMKYSAASTAAQTITVFSFYSQIVSKNPITNMYEISAV